MTNQTRKRLLPVALVMAAAVIGVVALTIALTGPAAELQAHGNSPGSCDSDAGRAVHDLISPNDPCPEPTPATPPTPAPTPTPAAGGPGEPSSYVIEGPDFVLQDRQSVTRYTINVLDEDGNPPNFAQRAGSENVTVYLDVVDTATGDVDQTQHCLPEDSNAMARDNMGMDLNSCTFTMDVSKAEPWFEIVATTIPHGTDVGITLEVDGEPVGDTHTVTFLNPAPPTGIEILSLCVKFRPNAETGAIEVEVMPSTTGDLTDSISDHRIFVRQYKATTMLPSADGAAMDADNPNVRVFGSADLDEDGMLTATFTGAQAGTAYSVFVLTDNLDAQGNKKPQTAEGTVIVRQASP